MKTRPTSTLPSATIAARGLALIELMVALTIGMVLALGILILMSSTSRSYKISDEFARMQENGASAIRYMSDDIHMAGFFGMAGTTDAMQTFDTNGDGFIDYAQDVLPTPPNFGTTAGQDCGAANWSLQPGFPISGLAVGTTGAAANAALPCVPAVNFVTGPALIVRGALGSMVNGANAVVNTVPIKQPANVTAGMLDNNTLYIQSDPFLGFVFQGSQFATYKNANYSRVVPVAGGGFVDAPIYQYQSRIYYIRPCSRPTGALIHGNPTCQATDDAGKPIPTLVRQEWQSTPGGPALLETALVEGVEQMGVLYGYDTLAATGNPIPVGCNFPGQCNDFPDGVADSYTAVPPTAANSTQVVAVRLNLLVRASAPTAGYDDSAKTYDLGGGVTFNCATAGGGQLCNYKRHVYSQLIQLRNASIRRNG